MSKNKEHSAKQGIVATANLATIYQREIFFQVDPATLDYIDHQELKDKMPRGDFIEFNPEAYLKYVPELEAEIFWLLFNKGKNQKDVAKLLNLSQPTISYRYRRTLDKFSYLVLIDKAGVKEKLQDLDFLKEKEREILRDLFFYANQELVGKEHGVRQSSVKWIFVKAKRRVHELEREAPERWSHHLGLLLLLERNLGMRIIQ